MVQRLTHIPDDVIKCHPTTPHLVMGWGSGVARAGIILDDDATLLYLDPERMEALTRSNLLNSQIQPHYLTITERERQCAHYWVPCDIAIISLYMNWNVEILRAGKAQAEHPVITHMLKLCFENDIFTNLDKRKQLFAILFHRYSMFSISARRWKGMPDCTKAEQEFLNINGFNLDDRALYNYIDMNEVSSLDCDSNLAYIEDTCRQGEEYKWAQKRMCQQI